MQNRVGKSSIGTEIRECQAKLKLFRKLAERRRKKYFPHAIYKVRTEEGFYIPFYPGDIVARHIWLKGIYENAERKVFSRLATDARCVFDVGANFGLYTLISAQFSPKECRIVSIEASSKEFEKLQLALSWNGALIGNRVAALNVAATHEDGELEIHESLDGYGALNRLDGPAKADRPYQKRTIQGRNLDKVWREYSLPPVDLFKLDVEGHEFPVLEGATLIVEDHKPVFMIEMNDKRASRQSTPVKIWEYMEQLGYRWFIANKSGRRLIEFKMPKRFGYLNLFAIHENRIETVLTKAETSTPGQDKPFNPTSVPGN